MIQYFFFYIEIGSLQRTVKKKTEKEQSYEQSEEYGQWVLTDDVLNQRDVLKDF